MSKSKAQVRRKRRIEVDYLYFWDNLGSIKVWVVKDLVCFTNLNKG